MNRNTFLTLILALFVATATSAQFQKTDDFGKAWQRIDSLMDSGLPKSAAKVAREILAAAQRKGDGPNGIKAQLFLIGVDNSIQDNAEIRNVQHVDSMIQVSDGVEKALWQSIGGELYWQYYQRHRWTILGRTPIAGTRPADIAAWDAASFVSKASDLYLASILDREALKAIPVERYAPLLLEGKNTRHLRPTLYDFLAFRAIDFFQNDEKDVTKPAYQFQIAGTLWFEPAAQFSSVKVSPADPEALHFRALHTYQQILNFHLNDEQPDALIDADLQRLAFVHQYSVHPQKDSLYLEALSSLERTYSDIPAVAQVAYHKLRFLYDNRRARVTTGTSDLATLKTQLDAIIARFPETEGAANAAQLRHDLTNKEMSLQSEAVILPGENSKVLVTYRNLAHLFLRIYRLPSEVNGHQRGLSKEEQTHILSQQALRSWDVALPGSDDLNEHRAELHIEPLPHGSYLLVASANARFTTDENAMYAVPFQASEVSMLTQHSSDQSWLVALHRKSGMPLRGAQVIFWENRWDSATKDYEFIKLAESRTDEDGRAAITIPKMNSREINRISLIAKGDTLQTDGFYYTRTRKENDEKTRVQTFLFTDRGLYRPGQTIHFKGIMVAHDIEQQSNTVLANETTEVKLYDANNQEVSTMQLTTNAYGSFSGKFTAPTNGITGEMRIAHAHGTAYIAVEEYKRPKFLVTFDTLKTAFELNQQVTVSGSTQAYAGNNIDNAEVKYRVVRQARFPYFWAFYRYGQPRSPEMEITNGVVKTDVDGSFEIQFTTVPDQQIDPASQPVFTYTIYADVTDVNGETQSGSQGVQAGYRALQIQAYIPEQLNARKTHQLMVQTVNLNQVPTPADVSVSVAPLKFPGQLYRKRLWEKPDQYLLSESEFRSAFPDDEYGDEGDYLTWPVEEPIWNTTLNTGQQTEATLPNTLWKTEGWYVIGLWTRDTGGHIVEEKKYVYVSFPTADVQPQTAISVSDPKLALEPGERLNLTVKTGYDNTYVLESNLDVSPQFTAFSEYRQIDRAISENDRGGLEYRWTYVYNNRVYSASRRVEVPWSNRELQLEWATHRDKLLPGESEEWRLTIKGPKKDAVAAELVAGLYDASLDALRPHRWLWDRLSPTKSLSDYWNTQAAFGTRYGSTWENSLNGAVPEGYEKRYDRLFSYPYIAYQRNPGIFGISRMGAPVAESKVSLELAGKAADVQPTEERVVVGFGEDEATNNANASPESPPEQVGAIPIRSNLQETAFFMPELTTDTAGNVSIRFTMPEALTEWKLMALAHTTDWKTGYLEGTIKTQKELMIIPNLPRFLRQKDEIRISARVSNISSEAMTGTARLTLLDATTLEPVNGFGDALSPQDFAVNANQSATVDWFLKVPVGHTSPVVIRVTATAGNFTDGEEDTLPVISNRTLVTETLPLPIRSNESKSFTLAKLLEEGSNSLSNHALTVEFTGNPAWYAVQALPYLMENPDECADQVFNRFYATALAAHIVDQTPRVKAIFDQWKSTDTTALLSNLEKNQELKSALLEETPWVMEARNEGEQKRRIAQLFENHKLAGDLQRDLAKLAEAQLSDGSFPWFRGMMSNRYITQYIATGIARLQKLGVAAANTETAQKILKGAVGYTDRQVKSDYDKLLEDKADPRLQHIGAIHVQYLYLRSLLGNLSIPQESKTAYQYYLSQAVAHWNRFNPYLKGQIALALNRRGNDPKTLSDIMLSLRETAIQSEELGMYWKSMPHGHWWYEAPIEAQSLLIEAFAEVAADSDAVDDLKIWLLKQKQTQHWNTTKATADAIYALLLQGGDWLSNEPRVTVTLGTETIRSTEMETEAGTGYFKKRFDGSEITPAMGNIAVKVGKSSNESVAWGAVYWQYFEDLDKITVAETPLSLRKQLYIKRNTDRGTVLEEITAKNPLRVGDQVVVRIEIRLDRDMEFIHLKDMRAACFEPINVLSGHRYQNGLGYYESTRDASTNFFFDYLQKGTYVFEYPVIVSQAGDFSSGISTLQSMYAPEFSSHSEGVRVAVTGE